MHSPTLFFDFRCRGETHGRVFISSWPGNQCFCLGQPDSRSAPVTCSSYYWTLFHWQSRKEERRGTLIAHLNGGCHIINAYRPALQAVTETPSHGSREKEGEWDINSCERRDGYQRPEIKWLALKEMGPEMSQPSERGVRCTCFASLVQTFAFWSIQRGVYQSQTDCGTDSIIWPLMLLLMIFLLKMSVSCCSCYFHSCPGNHRWNWCAQVSWHPTWFW